MDFDLIIRNGNIADGSGEGIFEGDIAVSSGKIVAVGNGTSEHKMNVKVGDSVLYGKYSGTELSISGTDYLIMKESDIFGIV